MMDDFKLTTWKQAALTVKTPNAGDFLAYCVGVGCTWMGEVNTAYVNPTRCPECGLGGVRIWKAATSVTQGVFNEDDIQRDITGKCQVPQEAVKRWDCPCPSPPGWCGKYLLYGPGRSIDGSTDVLWVMASFSFEPGEEALRVPNWGLVSLEEIQQIPEYCFGDAHLAAYMQLWLMGGLDKILADEFEAMRRSS